VKIYKLERKQLIRKPIDAVFPFFEDAENLSKITPSNLDFKIMTPLPIDMKAGTLIDYTIKVFGIRVHWRTLISDYNPPHYFTDEQLKGPYSFWHHRHEFLSIAEGTLIRDTVTYALPFGVIGRVAHALFVKRQLQKIFDFRTSAINTVFGAK